LEPFSHKLDDHLDLFCRYQYFEFPSPSYAPVLRSWQTKSSKTAPYYPHTNADGTTTTSAHWTPGFKVRYALAYLFDLPGQQAHVSDIGPWTEWLSSDTGIHPGLAVEQTGWTGKANVRFLYRQFGDEHQPFELVRQFRILPDKPDMLFPLSPDGSGVYVDTKP
jgi:hypothetical protein